MAEEGEPDAGVLRIAGRAALLGLRIRARFAQAQQAGDLGSLACIQIVVVVRDPYLT